jgi:hypothetical protein
MTEKQHVLVFYRRMFSLRQGRIFLKDICRHMIRTPLYCVSVEEYSCKSSLNVYRKNSSFPSESSSRDQKTTVGKCIGHTGLEEEKKFAPGR